MKEKLRLPDPVPVSITVSPGLTLRFAMTKAMSIE